MKILNAKNQYKLFKINIRILRLDQFQLSGFDFINQFKNIVVTFLAATYVVKDQMTLGVLLSISYIIGQMNSPINQLVGFFRSLQDAKVSLERLNEVQTQPEEEQQGQLGLDIHSSTGIILRIPDKKIIAIVGASGSGKTTLMKLLLKFYEPVEGGIFYNHIDFKNISPYDLRTHCGVVMQDGFIFSDTIERNIITGDKTANEVKLKKAVQISNLVPYY